jgi:sec-independent protein translocase protein TatC
LFSVALWAGLFIAAPFVFYQLWKFVAPGLYKRERRYGVAFAVCSGVLFLGGALFCYGVVLEPLYRYLLGHADPNLAEVSKGLGIEYSLGEPIPLVPQLFMEEYLGLSRKMMLGFGLVFELPLLIMFLAVAGVVTHRSLWKFNRWAIVLSFVIGAILTPSPDVMSQLLMAGPMIVLYNVSIVIAWVITARRERAESPSYGPEPPEGDDAGAA